MNPILNQIIIQYYYLKKKKEYFTKNSNKDKMNTQR